MGGLLLASASFAHAEHAHKHAAKEKPVVISQKDYKDAERTIENFKKHVPAAKKHFASAPAFVVFHTIGQGGLVIGGAGGQGILFENRNGEHVADGIVNFGAVSIGATLGGQKYSEVIFLTHAALKDLKQNKFEFDAQATAEAGKKGVASEFAYKNGVRVFIYQQEGLGVDASFGGQRYGYKPAHVAHHHKK
jgi:lipid-binding SYLF domain-containing protein